jgi:hypothetical protein
MTRYLGGVGVPDWQTSDESPTLPAHEFLTN